MSKKDTIILYGSYGYTGRLIADECRSKGLHVILSGRNEGALHAQSFKTGFPYEVVDLTDEQSLLHLLEKGAVVIHCGGPFQFTAKRMVEACLKTKTHYTDITGEHEVFETMSTYDAQAKAAGIMIMSGTGFDVVPSDCLALHLRKKLSSATHLQLAFKMTKGGLSRGTSRTLIEGLGQGSMIRENGKLKRIPLGELVLDVDFGPFQSKALNIPWGDISTAWRSTGIPNIAVFMGANASTIRNAKLSRYVNWLLKRDWVKKFLRSKIDSKPDGPSNERRSSGKSFLWGKVWDEKGNSVTSRLEVPNGYTLTAIASVLIADKILHTHFTPGYQTPAMMYGEKLVEEAGGTFSDSAF
jgi:short subunit dehydrogenase-like uncharacterized protein